MSDLIAPHGGLQEPVERTASGARADQLRQQASGLKKVPVSDADLSTLYRLGDGGLSPLTGPMNREVFHRVLDEEVVISGGKKYAWTIPLSFPVDAEQAKLITPGATVALTNGQGAVVGTLKVIDVFPFDKNT